MTISRIDRQRKNPNRHSVFIDGEFAFGLEETDLLYYKLTEGEEISEERLGYIIDNVVYVKACEKAMNYLSYRARTSKEIRDKLAGADYGVDVINRVLEMLKRYNYIDDEKFAAAYIQSRVSVGGYGEYKIKQELLQKGIPKQMTERLLEELSPDEQAAAEKMLEKRLRRYDPEDLDWKEKKRCSDYLARRGFSYDVIRKALAVYFN